MTEEAESVTRGAADLAEVLELLRKMSMEVHAFLADAGRAAGLNAIDVACIGIARQAERDGVHLSAGMLSHRLGLSPAATTALLDRMGRHGLVTRERSADDARVVLIRITDRARELGREMFQPLNEAYVKALQGKTDSVGGLIPVLQQLVESTESAREAHS